MFAASAAFEADLRRERSLGSGAQPRAGQSLLSRRLFNDCASMVNKLGQLGVVPKPQREHVA
jgi:hypothetical protein